MTNVPCRIYPDDLVTRAGPNGFDADAFYSGSPVNPSAVWSGHREAISVPTQMHFSNESLCAGKPLTLLTAIYEGFGNALIEAFYHRKPVLVNRYSIFVTDIEPKGFQVITMNGYLTRSVVSYVERVINDHEYRTAMVDHNFELGKAFFSYSVLRRRLRVLVTNYTGLDDL